MVLDRVNKNAYMAESNRSNVSLASKWSQLRGYDLVHFKSYIDKKPTYHTNVLMFITNKFVEYVLIQFPILNTYYQILKKLIRFFIYL